LARQAAARRVVPAVWTVRLWAHPHSEASSVRRDAAEAPSSNFRQVAGRPLVAPSEPAWRQVPGWWRVLERCPVPPVAWRQPAGAAPRVMASPSGTKVAAEAA
jgi:hypothetical protein